MSTPEFALPPGRSWATRVCDLVCGTEHGVRVRVRHQLPANFVFLCCAAFLLTAVLQGWVPRLRGTVLFVFIVLGQSTFYALLRSGWSERCRDYGLMLPQNYFALIAIALAYTLLGPVRGAPLILATQVLVYGMFSLTPRQAAVLGAFSVLLLGATAGLMSWFDPRSFPPRQELVRFMVILVTLPTISVCVCSVARLRERLVQQKQALRDALQQAHELATRDPLTGLFNRLHMQTLLEQERARQDRYGGAFSVALLDIDHFKRVNDSHGHRTGDAVLRRFAAIAGEVLRDADVLARWGGEEFLVLFPATHLDSARLGLQRLRERLARETWAAVHPGLTVTFSAGLAEHRTEDSISQTLERADRALYRAKAGGRNQDQGCDQPPG